MPLKRLPGTAALGLLASLIAHTVLFGDDHVVGGSAHWPIALTAAAAAAGCFFSLWRLAYGHAQSIAGGTRLAAQLRPYLPQTAWVALAALASYGGIEFCEGDGHAPAAMWLVALALILVSFLLCGIAASITRLVAAVAVRVRHGSPVIRPTLFPRARARVAAARPQPVRFRLFSRPPPVVLSGF